MLKVGTASLGESKLRSSDPPTANLLLWLDADANVSLSGSSVLSWEDFRKNGTVFTSSSGSRPTLDYSNNIVSVSSNGSQYLTNTGISLPSTYSVFALANRTGGSGYQILVNFSTGNYVLFFGVNAGNFATFTGNGSNAWNDVSSNSPTTEIGTAYRTLSVTNDNSTLRPYIDATTMTTKTGTTTTATGMILFVGGSGGSSQYWTGGLRKLLVYSSVLSSDDRQAVWNYFTN